MTVSQLAYELVKHRPSYMRVNVGGHVRTSFMANNLRRYLARVGIDAKLYPAPGRITVKFGETTLVLNYDKGKLHER